MPVSELVLDNVSPLLQFSGQWHAGRKEDDDQYDQYSNGGTFAVTNSNDAKVTISFSGTGLTVFGAKRPNHNGFTVQIDGNTPLPSDGHSDTDDIRVELYSTSTLRDMKHDIVIQNASEDPDPEHSYLDIDEVYLFTTIADTDREDAVKDSNPLWQYLPTEAWGVSKPSNLVHNPASDESARYSNSAGATATLYFSGTGIDLYGIVCQQCELYGVSIDNGPETVYNANNADHNVDYQVMYFTRGLDDATHSIKITNRGNGGAFLGIDHAVVYGARPGATAGPTADPANPGTSSEASPTVSSGAHSTPPVVNAPAPESSSPTGSDANPQATETRISSDGKRLPLAEIVCGVLAVLLLSLGLFVFFLLRQRKRRGRRPGPVGGWRESIIPASPISPTAMASPFTLSMHGVPASFAPVSRSNTSQSNSNNNGYGYGMGLRPPTPASLRSGSASANPFDAPGVYGSHSDGTSDGGLPYDQATLLQSPARARSPGPVLQLQPHLVLHEAPPAYDSTSRPASLIVDRKM